MLEIQGNNKTVNNNTITFTPSQEIAARGLTEFINTPFNNNNYINGLVGPGGVGKTFIINYIISNYKKSSMTIKCTSTTHKACRVFSQSLNHRKVETIQSTFGLRLDLRLEDFNPNNPQFNPSASPKLNEVRILFIDEASMLPAGLVTYINKICKENSIKIIYIGDTSQLSPVNEKKSIAFNTCSRIYELTEIVRQGESNPIIDLLTMLRKDIANRTTNFLSYISTHVGLNNYNDNGEGYSVLGPEGFKNFIDMSFSDEAYTKNIDMYRIIAYTNNCVTAWNSYIRNNIIDSAHKGIITKDDLIMSYETIVNEFNEIILNNSEEYIINDIVSHVDDKYDFNGYLIKFQLIHGGTITKPIFVLNHLDPYSIRMYDKVVSDLINTARNATMGTRAAKWKDYFNFKKKYLLATNIQKGGKVVYQRDLDYGFSITSHKSQGSTYDTVFVDLNDMVYNKNGVIYGNYDDMLRRIYVACSRARHNLIICYGNKN